MRVASLMVLLLMRDVFGLPGSALALPAAFLLVVPALQRVRALLAHLSGASLSHGGGSGAEETAGQTTHAGGDVRTQSDGFSGSSCFHCSFSRRSI